MMSKKTPHKISCFLEKILKSSHFNNMVLTLAFVNAVTLGLDTYPLIHQKYGSILANLDFFILLFFTSELLLKIIIYGKKDFLASGWYIFDVIIITLAWFAVSKFGEDYAFWSILRVLRVLKPLRLLSGTPQMRRVITAMIHSIPGMMSVFVLLLFIFYVSSVLATQLFGKYNDPNMQEWFSSIQASAYTLFQIITLDSWSTGVVRPTMDLFPWAWAFFIPFVIITSFIILNFFIGVIVESMQNAQRLEDEEKDTADDLPATKKDLKLLLQELETLNRRLEHLEKPKSKL